MKEYKIISSDYEELSLEDVNNTTIGVLRFGKLFSDKSQIILGEETYNIDSKGFLPIKWEVTKNEKIMLVYNKELLGGDIILSSFLDETNLIYFFRRVGIIKTSFQLLSKDSEELIRIKRKFKLDVASYEYIITTENHFKNIELLLLVLAHCITTQLESV